MASALIAAHTRGVAFCTDDAAILTSFLIVAKQAPFAVSRSTAWLCKFTVRLETVSRLGMAEESVGTLL